MLKKPKIGCVLTPITFGGSEQVNLNYLKNADRDSFEILPILLRRPWEKESLFELGLKKYDYRWREISVARKPRDGYLRIVRCMADLFSLASQERLDILHSHGYFADIVAAIVSHLLGIHHISTCHGFILTCSKLRLYNWVDYQVLRMCDRIIAVSDKIRGDLRNKGIRADRIAMIPNGVERSSRTISKAQDRKRIREFLGITEGEIVIGYIGRLSEEKGLEYLIQAGAIWHGNGHIFRIVLVGEGPERQKLLSLAERNGIAGSVIFAGFQHEVRFWLKAIDVFVLPSLTEGTPLSLLEAMAEGIPAVATAVGEVPRIIRDRVNGCLISPKDGKAIAEAVEYLLRNRGKAESYAAQAQEMIETDFNIDLWRRRIEEQYVSVLRSKLISQKKD